MLVKDGLWLLRRPDDEDCAEAAVCGRVSAPGVGTIIFRRDNGRVAALSVVSDRVWDLRFKRVNAPSR